MLLSFFNLREQPFGVTPDPRYLYYSRSHLETLVSLTYGVESGLGFMALIAPPGMGKTTLLVRIMDQFSESAQTAFLFQTQCDSRELLRYVLTDLGLDASHTDIVRMHHQFYEALLRENRAGKRVVLVIDEAQNLTDDVLESIRLLSDFETPRAKLLQIILAGQEQLSARLASAGQMQLRQRISMFCKLAPFGPDDTQHYIEHRLAIAGYDGDPLFTPDAIDVIAECSGGIPRIINNYCFNALTMSYALGRKQIDGGIVAEVARDLEPDPATRARLQERLGQYHRVPFKAVPMPVSVPELAHLATGMHAMQSVAPTDVAPTDAPPVPRQTTSVAAVAQPFADAAPVPATMSEGTALMPAAETAPVSSAGITVHSLSSCLSIAAATALAPAVAPPASPAPAPAPTLILVPKPQTQGEKPTEKSEPQITESSVAVGPPKATAAPIVTPVVQERSKIEASAAAATANDFMTVWTAAQALREKNTAAGARSAVAVSAAPVSPVPVKSGARHHVWPRVFTPVAIAVLLVVVAVWMLRSANPHAQAAAAPPFRTAVVPPPPAVNAAGPTSPVVLASLQTAPKPITEKTISPPRRAIPVAHEERDTPVAPPKVSEVIPGAVESGSGLGEMLVATASLPVLNHPAPPAPNLVPGALMKQVMPTYPEIARHAGIAGSVTIKALIQKDGSIGAVTVMSGHPLLRSAAVAAVRQWRYRPFYLNGEPVTAETNITLNFKP